MTVPSTLASSTNGATVYEVKLLSGSTGTMRLLVGYDAGKIDDAALLRRLSGVNGGIVVRRIR